MEDWLERAKNGEGASAFWNGRYERILERARIHPIMLENVLDIFEETCPKSAYTKAHYVLGRMEKTKRIRFIGAVSFYGCGRKRNVWAKRHIKRDNLLHEVQVTRVVEALGWPDCDRGYDVGKDKRADAEIFMNGTTYYLEFDNGSMKRSQIEKRWKVYEDNDKPLLVVTTTEARMKSLLRWCSVGYFTTIKKVTETPWERIWETPEGRLKQIEQPVE